MIGTRKPDRALSHKGFRCAKFELPLTILVIRVIRVVNPACFRGFEPFESFELRISRELIHYLTEKRGRIYTRLFTAYEV